MPRTLRLSLWWDFALQLYVCPDTALYRAASSDVFTVKYTDNINNLTSLRFQQEGRIFEWTCCLEHLLSSNASCFMSRMPTREGLSSVWQALLEAVHAQEKLHWGEIALWGRWSPSRPLKVTWYRPPAIYFSHGCKWYASMIKCLWYANTYKAQYSSIISLFHDCS